MTDLVPLFKCTPHSCIGPPFAEPILVLPTKSCVPSLPTSVLIELGNIFSEATTDLPVTFSMSQCDHWSVPARKPDGIGGPLVLQTTLKASKDVFVLRKDEFEICYAGIKRNSTSGNSELASTRWYGARMACMRPACRWTLGRNSSDCWIPSISPAR